MDEKTKRIVTAAAAVGAVGLGAAAIYQLQKTKAQLAAAEQQLAALKGGKTAATPTASSAGGSLFSPSSSLNRPAPSPSNAAPSSSSVSAAAGAGGKKRPIRVYVDGVFDLMHYGHSNALRQAKACCAGMLPPGVTLQAGETLGEVELVVGLVADDEVVRNKGSAPVMPEEERYQALEGCKFASSVIRGAPYELSETWVKTLLTDYKIDWFVHGDDPCFTADGKDAYAFCKSIGRYRSFKRTEGVSTTDIVGRMLLMTKEHHVPEESPSSSSSSGSGGASASEGVTTAKIERSVRSSSLGSAKELEEGASSSSSSSAGGAASPLPPVHSKFLPTARRIMQFADGKAPKPDDKVVYCAGSWDLFNAGHIAALKKAREFGTFLLVGIHDDSTVNKLRGHGLPVLNLYERTLSLLSCRWVDEVVIGAPLEITPDLLKTFNISVVVKGSISDSTNQKGHEFLGWGYSEEKANAAIDAAYKVPKELGILKTFESPSSLTALDIVERILAARQTFQKRYEKKSAMEEQYYNKSKEYIQEA